MLRSVAGVVVGYLVFALAAAVLFRLTGQDPHAAVSLAYAVGATLYGIFFAGAGGFLAARIAGRRPLVHGGIVGLVIGLGAFTSLVLDRAGAHWSQLAAIFLMAPAAFSGGAVELSRMGRERQRTLVRVK